MKFVNVVLQVNMHRLTESIFQFHSTSHFQDGSHDDGHFVVPLGECKCIICPVYAATFANSWSNALSHLLLIFLCSCAVVSVLLFMKLCCVIFAIILKVKCLFPFHLICSKC